MIYYFSGTGNTLRIARCLSEILGEEMERIGWDTVPVLRGREKEATGIMFPIYAWGMPRVVSRFLDRMPVCPAGYTPYIYIVMTCGDDIGRTDRLLRKRLERKGLKLAAAFSLQMRNTYVCLPGFDTDSAEVETRKDAVSLERARRVAETIRRRRSSSSSDITPGAIPWLKTYVLRPLFNTFLVDDNRFRCNHARCTHCGRCGKVCPLGNIEFSKARTPRWKGHCTHCLACYHACPPHAIEYGFFTRHKGQVKINA